MISWKTCFSEPYESAWCTAQKLAWLQASYATDALSAVAGRPIRASPSLRKRDFYDLTWWKTLLDDSDARALSEERMEPWRALLSGGLEVTLGSAARSLRYVSMP